MAKYRCMLAAPLLILLLQLLLLHSPGEAAAAAAAENEEPVHWRATDVGQREGFDFERQGGRAVSLGSHIRGSKQKEHDSDASRRYASDVAYAGRGRQLDASVDRLRKRTYFDPMGYGKKKRTYFDPMGYGKKKRTYFDPMGYGKKKRTYFDPMGYGKKKRTYFDPMGYGKKRAYFDPLNSRQEHDSGIDQSRYSGEE